MLSPDSRAVAFDLLRPPVGYRLDLAVLTTYTLDLEALLVLPLSVLAHPDGGLDELLADPLRLHQAIREAGDRIHAFVDEKGIAIPRSARPLYSMLESSVHPVRAPNGGAFHPKVWVARFAASDENFYPVLRLAILSRNLTFDRSWDIALSSESPLKSGRRVAASRPLRDFLLALPQLATGHVAADVTEKIQVLADQVARTAFPAPDGFDAPIEFHALGLQRRRRSWRPPTRGYRTLAVAPFVNRTGLELVGKIGGNDRTLVSRREELDKLPEDMLAEWKDVYVLSDTAQGESEAIVADRAVQAEGGIDRPSRLHAKMIAVEHGWEVTWFVGSANLTSAAFRGDNVEMMASVTGKKGRKGGASGCGIDRFLESGFRSLLETRDGKRVRTLLLSATPYKLYTADAEIEREDHYEDFLATTRFLLGDDICRVEEVKQRLSRFGSALKRGAAGERNHVKQVEVAKRDVEDALRNVMARTERVSASEKRDAMVDEVPRTTTVNSSDVRQYLAADALFRAVGDRDPMSFWKSAPYLAHFMHGYRFNERFEEAIRAPEKIANALQRHDSAYLKAGELRSWSEIDPANPKLRELVDELICDGLWKLLWMPPTLPYWPLEGPFKGKEQATKRLLFSAWNVVPDVVSAILSYEAERLMTGAGSRIGSYESPAEQQRPLLRLTQSKDRGRSRHRLLLLLLPCIPLADLAHPLHAPPGHDRRAWVRARVDDLLADPELPNPQDGEIDDRWEWVATLLLDSGLRSFLRGWSRGERPDLSADKPLPQPNPDVFGRYVDDLLGVEPGDLGRRPPSLPDLLTDVALGSPAILAARSLKGGTSIDDVARRRLAAGISHAFWSLFNQPAVIALMRQLAADSADSKDESAYWRLVLRYCRQGNLQAVLDEQWHLLWEQELWSKDTTEDETAGLCALKLVETVRPTRARVHARFFEARGGGTEATLESDEIRIRTAFALRFGHIRTEEGDPISQDAVRTAFNSPFRPFVLTSTSIGQEGLDFHPWCHCLVHWNLPGNPVDLEQREGRIHRYKGHAIRRNVAASHDADALASWRLGDDIWTLIFEMAEKAARSIGDNDLVPHWIAPGRHAVRRYVPQLPYTTEVEAFERLKRQLAAYRVVFGQPRQEELVTLLGRSEVTTARLNDWAVDLSPPAFPIDRE